MRHTQQQSNEQKDDTRKGLLQYLKDAFSPPETDSSVIDGTYRMLHKNFIKGAPPKPPQE